MHSLCTPLSKYFSCLHNQPEAKENVSSKLNPSGAKRILSKRLQLCNAAHVPAIARKTATLASHQERFWQPEPCLMHRASLQNRRRTDSKGNFLTLLPANCCYTDLVYPQHINLPTTHRQSFLPQDRYPATVSHSAWVAKGILI